MADHNGYKTPGFDSFRPGQIFNLSEFIKMKLEEEHDTCPTCGQKIPPKDDSDDEDE